MNASFCWQQRACHPQQQQTPLLQFQQQQHASAAVLHRRPSFHQQPQQYMQPHQLVQQQQRQRWRPPPVAQAIATAAAATCQPHQQQQHPRHNNSSSSRRSRCCHLPQHEQQQRHRPCIRTSAAAGAAAADGFDGSSSEQQQQQHSHHGAGSKAIPPRIQAAADEETYSLKDTQILVETAMLSAVSGLAFLLSTLLKLDNSLGYFLPLPITIAACRSGVAAGWHTMMATAFLLLVLLGPLRSITYVLMHGVLAASLGSMWVWKWPWALSIPAGAVLRMAGQLGYLVLSSVTMNENLFQVMLANVHNLLDQLSAALGSSGSPSPLAITSMIFALLLVNGLCYCFLLHVVYHVILGSMGFKLGALPGFVRKYLYAGTPQGQGAAAAGEAVAAAAAAEEQPQKGLQRQ